MLNQISLSCVHLKTQRLNAAAFTNKASMSQEGNTDLHLMSLIQMDYGECQVKMDLPFLME